MAEVSQKHEISTAGNGDGSLLRRALCWFTSPCQLRQTDTGPPAHAAPGRDPAAPGLRCCLDGGSDGSSGQSARWPLVLRRASQGSTGVGFVTRATQRSAKQRRLRGARPGAHAGVRAGDGHGGSTGNPRCVRTRQRSRISHAGSKGPTWYKEQSAPQRCRANPIASGIDGFAKEVWQWQNGLWLSRPR